MTKLITLAGLAVAAFAVPVAQASNEHAHEHATNNPHRAAAPGQNKTHGQNAGDKGESRKGESGKGEKHTSNSHKPDSPAAKCTPHAVGYHARGTLVSSSLTQTAGADTAKRGDDRFSGDVTVNVKKANHKAPTGEQTFTLTNARVRFADADHNHVADVPKAGDRVKLHGKITKLNRKCDQTGFEAKITVRRAQFKAPKPTTSPPVPEKAKS